ncbi:MAG: ion transporter [Spirochaetales bacterium]|nr:ion transporter [Spirochaetales bacterium]
MQSKIKNFVESIVIMAIFLVLIQTFLEDYAVLTGWSWDLRRILIFTGLGFDLFFSLEFLIRFFSALLNKKGSSYFLEGKGWIDFLASIPLLILNSGPAFLAIITGSSFFFGMGGLLNILKIIKAIRIARILRLLRILKIFRQIKHTGSIMAQRHIAKITTLSITSFVFTLLVFSIFSGLISLPSAEGTFINHQKVSINNFLVNAKSGDTSSAALGFADYEADLLIIKNKGETIFTRYDNPFYSTVFGPGDYQYFKTTDFEFFFDVRELAQIQASSNILFFLVVVMSVLVFLIYYSPHFALTITDPIHVMKKGFLENDYNLEVEIPELYENDDIYKLGALYNEKYLPLKVRETETNKTQSNLSMDDFEDLFK